jgi:hypothetical protein
VIITLSGTAKLLLMPAELLSGIDSGPGKVSLQRLTAIGPVAVEVADAVGDADGVSVASGTVAVTLDVGVSVRVGDVVGVTLAASVGVGVPVTESVGVGARLGVAVGAENAVAVAVGLSAGVGERVGDRVAVPVIGGTVGGGVAFGVGVAVTAAVIPTVGVTVGSNSGRPKMRATVAPTSSSRTNPSRFASAPSLPGAPFRMRSSAGRSAAEMRRSRLLSPGSSACAWEGMTAAASNSAATARVHLPARCGDALSTVGIPPSIARVGMRAHALPHAPHGEIVVAGSGARVVLRTLQGRACWANDFFGDLAARTGECSCS